MSIDLPNDYENAIELTEVTRQDINTASAEQQSNFVVLDTSVQVAEIYTNITLYDAEGVAGTSILMCDASTETYLTI